MWYPPLTLHCPSDFPPLRRHGQQYCVAVIVVCLFVIALPAPFESPMVRYALAQLG